MPINFVKAQQLLQKMATSKTRVYVRPKANNEKFQQWARVARAARFRNFGDMRSSTRARQAVQRYEEM
jgi:hypothetical protein